MQVNMFPLLSVKHSIIYFEYINFQTVYAT